MSTRAQRRARSTRGLAIGAVIALIGLFGATAPAYAAPPTAPVVKYVALGDSYAAGQGAGPQLDACFHTAASYAALLDAAPRTNLLRNAACSGATIADVATTQLSQVNKGTTLVTITVGANDLAPGAVYTACYLADLSQACADAGAHVATVLQGDALNNGIRDLVLAVAERAPNARIVVTDYPIPFIDTNVWVKEQVNAATLALDLKIAQGVAAAGAAGAKVSLASVAGAFWGHQIGNDDPYLGAVISNPVTFLHPTAAGQAIYRDAILAALAG
ncbi:GDSL-type esterase/lipase family protein [Microbacterium sp. P5_E9]